MKQKLPIGLSTLEKIRSEGCVYIDKTKFVKMLANGSYFFLSRPRRFGKSLMLDTIKQAFLGNKEVFKGLYLEDNWDWSTKYPVIHISFGKNSAYNSQFDLIKLIENILQEHAQTHGISIPSELPYNIKFDFLIKNIYRVTNQQIVVLVDEYDKPLLDVIDDKDKSRMTRDILKGLYSVVKDNDQYLRFVFLTGVTKFSKVSVFSGLNNLKDITLDSNYADICGYTQEALWDSFAPSLGGVDKELLKAWYNGYNFCGSEEQKVYNPFDILLFISEGKKYKNYWFETATPTFLLKLLKGKNYYLPNLENLVADDDLLSSFDIDDITLETLLFQSGYLTITEMIKQPLGQFMNYKLNYPNMEVRQSFNSHLLGYLLPNPARINTAKVNLANALIANEFDKIKDIFNTFFAGIPYNWYSKNRINEYEGFYATVIYSYFNALGIAAIPEDATSTGRIDLTLHLPDKFIILEFKVTENYGGNALEQIKTKRYYEKYQSQGKTIYLMGMDFSSKNRKVTLLEWEKVT